MVPAYKLEEFLTACSKGRGKVVVPRWAMEKAREHFNLETPARVLEFIRKGGLEQPRFYNSELWKNNPDPAVPIMVDAYEFYVGSILGYMAFLLQPKTNIWMIKSFKRNKQPSLRHLPFAERLKTLKKPETIH
jgi:hypothetical protein